MAEAKIKFEFDDYCGDRKGHAVFLVRGSMDDRWEATFQMLEAELDGVALQKPSYEFGFLYTWLTTAKRREISHHWRQTASAEEVTAPPAWMQKVLDEQAKKLSTGNVQECLDSRKKVA